MNYRNAVYKGTLQYPVFAVRSRNNACHAAPRFGGVSAFPNINHNLYRQVPIEKYRKIYPEYFCLWDGKRSIHTQVVPIVTQALLKEIALPDCVGRKNFFVSHMDSVWQYCQCPKCAAIDGAEESHMGALLAFVNEVAKTYPDVYIGTLAYGFSDVIRQRMEGILAHH